MFSSTNFKLKIVRKTKHFRRSRNHRKHQIAGNFGNEGNHSKDGYIGERLVKK
jgi:hypothetical protein